MFMMKTACHVGLGTEGDHFGSLGNEMRSEERQQPSRGTGLVRPDGVKDRDRGGGRRRRRERS